MPAGPGGDHLDPAVTGVGHGDVAGASAAMPVGAGQSARDAGPPSPLYPPAPPVPATAATLGPLRCRRRPGGARARRATVPPTAPAIHPYRGSTAS